MSAKTASIASARLRRRAAEPRTLAPPMNLLRAASTDLAASRWPRGSPGWCATSSSPSVFGASASIDAFNVAFRIPNLLRRLFGEGAFSQAFVPILARDARARGRRGDPRGWSTPSRPCCSGRCSLTCVVGVVAAPVIVWLMASGWSASTTRCVMTRCMFPYIGLHLAGLARRPASSTPGSASPCRRRRRCCSTSRMIGARLAAGAAVRALGHRADLRAGRRRDARRRAAARGAGPGAARASAAAAHRPRPARARARPGAIPGVRAVLRQMAPALLGVSVAQISLLINTQIASHQGVGAVSWLDLRRPADGVPDRAARRRARRGADPAALGGAGRERRRRLLRRCSTGACAWCCCSRCRARSALLVFPEPLVATLFQRGAVRRAGGATRRRSRCAATASACSGLIGVKILAPGFYARQDMRTPVKIAIVVLVLTQAMNLVFVPLFGHAGLALSIGLGAMINAALAVRRPAPRRLVTSPRRAGAGSRSRVVARHAAAGRRCCAWAADARSTGSACAGREWLRDRLARRLPRRCRRCCTSARSAWRASGRAISRVAARPAWPAASAGSKLVACPGSCRSCRRPRSTTSPRSWPTTRACRCSRPRSRSPRTTIPRLDVQAALAEIDALAARLQAPHRRRRRADAAAALAEPLLLPGARLRRQRQRLLRPAQQLPALRARDAARHPDHAGAALHRARHQIGLDARGVSFPGHFLVKLQHAAGRGRDRPVHRPVAVARRARRAARAVSPPPGPDGRLRRAARAASCRRRRRAR